MEPSNRPARLRKLLIFLPAAVLLTVVAVALWAVLTGRLDGSDPRARHVGAFMTALQERAFAAAYEHTTPDFRRRVPLGHFERAVEGHEVLRSFQGGELRFYYSSNRAWSAVSSGVVDTPSGEVPVEVQLEKFATGEFLVDNVRVRGVPVFPVRQ
ncbi:MAG: hypothetical protein JXR83_07895 [Deltaproteobacteria bacterium]|nr:hypothetical protein [Deltaproteobacteria bacterium]